VRTGRPPIPLAVRFWSRVQKTRGCWFFGGSPRRGYGRLWDNTQRRVVSAHRKAWELYYGPVPIGLSVCHHCDVENCVRPSHLFIGTTGDNVADRDAKGHTARPFGELNPQAKLTTSSVRKIRALLHGGLSQTQIAAQFGVSRSTIGQIKDGKGWRHVPGHLNQKEAPCSAT
jgi:hypothetical protein